MADLGDLGIGVKIDEKELTASVQKMQKEFIKTGQAFEKGINDPLDKNGKVTKEATKNMNTLDKSIDKTTKSTKGLTSSFTGFISKIGLIKSKRVDKSIDEAGNSADKAKRSFLGLGGATGGVNTAFGKLGATLGGITAIFAGGSEIARQEGFMRQLALQTGATGKEVDQLNKSFIDLQKQGFDNLEENVRVLSSVNKELGLIGDEATRVSTNLLTISKVFNKDINETTRASTALVKTFGISAVESTDILTVALQKTGDQYDDLLDSINEYSAKAADAGLSVDEFVSNLIQGTQAGIRNTDELADVQREFTTRIIDGSDKTREALEKLGIDYGKLEKDLRSGAISAGDAQSIVAKELLKVEDQILANQIASDLYGTRVDDNGKLILETLADNTSALGDTQGASERLANEYQKGLGVQFKALRGQVTSLASKGVPALSSAMVLLQKTIASVSFAVDALKIGMDSLLDAGFSITSKLRKEFSDTTDTLLAGTAKKSEVLKGKVRDLITGGVAGDKNFFENQAKETAKIYDKELENRLEQNEFQREKDLELLKQRRIDSEKEFEDLLASTQDQFKEINALTEDIAETGRKEIKEQEEKANAERYLKRLSDRQAELEDIADLEEKEAKARGKELLALQEQETKEHIKNTRDVYSDYVKQLDKAEEAYKDFSKNSEEFSRDIQDNIREINNEIRDLTESFEKANAQISEQETEDLAKRGIELNKEILEIDKEIAEVQAEQDKRHEENENFSYENQQRILELEKEKNKLIEERAIIESAVPKSVIQAQEQFEGLTEAEKIQKEAEERKRANEEEFNQEKKKLEDLQKINDFFNQQRDITQADIDKLRQEERFLALSEEEQRLILQLANEKALLTQQKDEAIRLQQDIASATIDLSNEVADIQKANLQSINSEYDELISKINTAISRQSQLSGSTNITETQTPGFATGGFTGEGSAEQVAGIVHKGEWVAPQWQVNQNKEIFKALEGQRISGSGGNVSNTKSQTNHITVNSEIDLKSAFDYFKWKI